MVDDDDLIVKELVKHILGVIYKKQCQWFYNEFMESFTC